MYKVHYKVEKRRCTTKNRQILLHFPFCLLSLQSFLSNSLQRLKKLSFWKK